MGWLSVVVLVSVGGSVESGDGNPTAVGVGRGVVDSDGIAEADAVGVLVGVGLGSPLGGAVGVGVDVDSDDDAADRVGEAVIVGVAVSVHGPNVSPCPMWACRVTESSSTTI